MPIHSGQAVELAAKGQVVFREVNEQIAKATDPIREIDFKLFICECSDLGCAESVEITAAEYEAVRADGTHFVVVPGHQLTGIERVVAGNVRYLVVETFGHAAQVAASDNPRLS